MDKELKIKAEEVMDPEAGKKKILLKLKGIAKKVALLIVVLAIGAGAYFVIDAKLKEKSGPKDISMSEYSDGAFDVDLNAKEKDLFKSVYREEFLFKLADASFPLKEEKGIRYVRIAFYLQANQKKDLDMVEKKEAQIVETINGVLRKSTASDFEGAQGKEAMRARLLKAINAELDPPLLNIRYGSLMFH